MRPEILLDEEFGTELIFCGGIPPSAQTLESFEFGLLGRDWDGEKPRNTARLVEKTL